MIKKQVAVIDISSKSITTIIGENGINNTFVIKYQSSYDYDGFSDGEFFDEGAFVALIQKASKEIKNYFNGKVGTIYVGVPSAFTQTIVRDNQISFPKKKKILEKDINTLYDETFNNSFENFTLINRSSILFELDDFRRVSNPVGIHSEILKGKLSYILCKNHFIELIEPSLLKGGANRVEFVSTALAEVLYLIEPDIRDRIAILLEVGFISSTLSIIRGDGIVFMKTFDYGGGYITADIVDKFSVSFEQADEIKKKVNLTSINDEEQIEVLSNERDMYFTSSEVKNCIVYSLDNFCELIANALNEYGSYLPEYVGLMITGGGVSCLRGAKEHIAGRLNMSVQIVSPNVPMMEKPTNSSKLSLLSLALEQI